MDTQFFDVAVVGGGGAGVFAAISAAKSGASVLLVEKNGILGGTTTAGRVNFPGLFHAWGRQIIDGPCWESVLRCVSRGGAILPEFPYRSEHHFEQQILLDVFTYACVLDEMCAESGVSLLLHSMVAEVAEEEEGVTLSIATKDGLRSVFARTVVDATGDADVIRMAGYPCLTSEVTQPATLIHDLGGYDPASVDDEALRVCVKKAYETGMLSLEDTQGRDICRMVRKGRIHMHLTGKDAHTSEGKGALDRMARAQLSRILSVLRTYPPLAGIRVERFGSECGVRETVRIVGERQVTAEEYLSGRVEEDSISYAFYPIDLHEPTGIKQIFLEDGVIPCVPYGALIPKGSHHFLAAGRCLSSDRDANSALRVQAVCMSTGQVAGAAAALCAKQSLCPISVKRDSLKRALHDLGAVVPEKPKAEG